MNDAITLRELRVLIEDMHRTALSAGVFGVQVVKGSDGMRSALDIRNEGQRTQAEKLVRFRALLSECKRIVDGL